jgi:DNA mismatch repair protein MutS
MQIDQITIEDLAIIKGEKSIYTLIDTCLTKKGSLLLRHLLQHPYDNIAQIEDVQHSIGFWTKNLDNFSWEITNGTLIMLEQFLSNNEFSDSVQADFALQIQTFFKRVFDKESIEHISFLYEQIHLLVKDAEKIRTCLSENASLLPLKLQQHHKLLSEALDIVYVNCFLKQGAVVKTKDKLVNVYQLKRYARSKLENIMEVIAWVDVLLVGARWSVHEKWSMPQLLPNSPMVFEAREMFHPIIENAISYNVQLSEKQNILVLTGANMSGKTTFMRSLGTSALLAHCGWPVPAMFMKLSLLNGFISQIHVQDDIVNGESYFYAEVLRIKQTALKINQKAYNLIILDELFKGTNVHDAYDCTLAILKGLQSKKNNLIIISTHLHELVDYISDDKAYKFQYFETQKDTNKHFHFTYKLLDGISKDRIGYALLKQEGVLDLLK